MLFAIVVCLAFLSFGRHGYLDSWPTDTSYRSRDHWSYHIVSLYQCGLCMSSFHWCRAGKLLPHYVTTPIDVNHHSMYSPSSNVLHLYNLTSFFSCFSPLSSLLFSSLLLYLLLHQCTWITTGTLGCQCYMSTIESIHTVYNTMVNISRYGFLDIHCSVDRSEYNAAQCHTQIVT